MTKTPKNMKKTKPTNKESSIILFKEKQIRRTWHNQEWWFSVVDVCGALTESADAGAYWRKLKQRLKEEGSEVVTNCHELKLEASGDEKIFLDSKLEENSVIQNFRITAKDGKNYNTQHYNLLSILDQPLKLTATGVQNVF